MHLIRKHNKTFCGLTVTIEDDFTLDPSKITCRDCILSRMNEQSGKREEVILYCHKVYGIPGNIDYHKRNKFRDVKAMDELIKNYKLNEIYDLTKPASPPLKSV